MILHSFISVSTDTPLKIGYFLITDIFHTIEKILDHFIFYLKKTSVKLLLVYYYRYKTYELFYLQISMYHQFSDYSSVFIELG